MPTLENNALVFRFLEIDPEARFSIDFQRTLRIPDSERDYPLPPGFGRFPLRHVEDYAALPAHTRRRGGVILPLWQAEALWLNFGGGWGGDLPVAVKVAAGKINAVTGETWTAPLNRNPQDYVVWPEQPWLDGFAIEPGVIRQFVAMPLGEGYSVEEQLTEDAEWGGLQISVTPMRREAWERLKTSHSVGLMEEVAFSMSSCASAEMGLGAGGRMRQSIESDPYTLEDWDQRATQRVFVTLWHASRWRALTGEPVPTEPPSAEDYARAGLPWFQHYGRGAEPLHGSDRLAGVKSVGTLHSEKTETSFPGSHDVATPEPVRLGPGAKGPREIKHGLDW
ncbi:hypothetical protein [Pseudothioclava arenosa]|uniref:Integral membrane protein n=1 Tax=Pseudothioclava arenosa TaxID=1795308 RepID=A0A2A4CI28_9RHOB|nr:hypothetical protein [Pseudothioclava arenosa]PCD75723.1 hypothetical protein CLN94_12485 [Pseudothioclava arenosa]